MLPDGIDMEEEYKEYAVVIKELHYSINKTQILKGITLRIRKGEFVGFIGPNGAGKTTLLKCINGLNSTRGCVWIYHNRLEQMSCKTVARQIAFMPQNNTINFPFPTIEIVLMGRYPHLKRLQGESLEDYKIARKYMSYTDTLKFEKKPITQLSGGERQRALFAKVLTQETDIILLDEPTASLDISHQEQIFKYSRQLSDNGKTVIAAVHDLKIASRYCSRLVLLSNGMIIADGAPEEVLTSKNISKAYGVNALVYKNRVTGLLDFYIPGTKNRREDCKHIHVIGGGGSASGIIRQLFEAGFKVTAGVFAHGDSDLTCAEVFGIEYFACKPFSEISEEVFRESIKYIRDSDMTILCNMPFGVLNYRNLELAAYASRLVIIEDDPPESRDFTGGKALELYNRLKQNAIVTESAKLHEVLY